MVIIVKKGMATKAFIKHCHTNNGKAIKKQIAKGLVKVFQQ